MPYITLSSTMAHLMATDDIIPTNEGSGYVRQGGLDLHSMSTYHQFGMRAIYILKILARNWGVAISIDGPIDINHAQQVCQPSTHSMNFFSLQESSLSRKSIHDHDSSPLFTPFPMQGLPLISVDGTSLREAGFARKSESLADSQ